MWVVVVVVVRTSVVFIVRKAFVLIYPQYSNSLASVKYRENTINNTLILDKRLLGIPGSDRYIR